MPEYLTDLLKFISANGLNALYNTAIFLFIFILPIVLFCIALLITSRWIDSRIIRTFGWRGLLLFAWLGTPVHELSHLVACVIGRNEILEFQLFKPDKKTGSLGHVYHAYNKNSFYQRIIGNSLISIAPFLGGSLVIYLLTWLLYPEFLATSGKLTQIENFTLTDFSSVKETISYIAQNTFTFWEMLFRLENLTNWKFWLYLFTMVSIAFRLSPSSSDFEGFWWPFVVLLAILYLIHFILECFNMGAITQQAFLSDYFSNLYALLTLSLLFLITTAIFITIITFMVNAALPQK